MLHLVLVLGESGCAVAVEQTVFSFEGLDNNFDS